MNWKKFILLTCVVPSVFAVSPATAQMRGHHPSTARMPMHRAPMLNSTSGFQRFRSSDFDRDDRFRRFHRFNDGDFDRDDRFRRFHRFNEIIVFDNFGFPFFPFYYPYPYYPYPYGSYYPYGGGVNVSLVVQVQRRLASAGFYSGPIDGVMGRGTRRSIRAFERSHGLPVDGTIHRRLLTTMGLA
jgi:Putative peptidoglycan binding domain